MNSLKLFNLINVLLLILLSDFKIGIHGQCIQLDDKTGSCPLPDDYLSFWVYNSDISDNPYKLTYENIDDAPFYPYTTTIFMSHGYTGWKDYSPNMEVRPMFMKHTNYTIVSIDWGTLCMEPCYLQATYNLKYVGICVGQFIDLLIQKGIIECKFLRLLGLSLGAHVVGNIGRSIKSCKVPRLTALDAALPLFDGFFFSDYSVKKSDAIFVDGYHTNCGVKGKFERYGHVDVYFNSCVYQPGCGTNTSCSHSRSADFFGPTIDPSICSYGYKCSSYSDACSGLCSTPSLNQTDQWFKIGEYINTSLTGVFEVITSDKTPFFPSGNPVCDQECASTTMN